MYVNQVTMPKILINGYFLCRPLTGIERYAVEITRRLDELSKPGELAVIIPGDTRDKKIPVPPYQRITVIRHSTFQPHIRWQMLALQSFLLAHRQYVILDFGNTCLPLAPGIVFLHDIYCEFFPEDFTSLRDKLARLYNRWQYRLIARRAKRIITVSQFSRAQIARTCRIDPERIAVIYNGWEHVKSFVPDFSVFSDFPQLEGPFYFALGSLSRRKNLAWIVEYAAVHPDALFAISGTGMPTARDSALGGIVPANVLLLGYLEDGKVRALMERCKAFIMPSYYEGFGIPPLEALVCGAQIIVANAASLPEIYGKTAHYIDPFDTAADLDKLLEQPVERPDALLAKYSYDTSAEKTYEIIHGMG
jgi:glycosyltransferase involved in cell wall biosynthesis